MGEQFIGDVSVNVRHDFRVTIQQRLAFIEKDIGESTERHDKYSDALAEARQNLVDFHTAHGALEQRVTTVENMIGDYTQKQNDLKLVIGRLQEVMDKRLHDCHECAQGVQERLQHEVDNWEKNCITFKQRIDVLERLVGNSADQMDQHAKELVEARNGAAELEENMREIHGALQSELKARDAHHANIQQRVGLLEKCSNDSVDGHAKHINKILGFMKEHGKTRDDLSAFADAHEKHRSALEAQCTAMEQRMSRIENMVEDMDRSTQKQQLAQLATCIVDVRSHVYQQTDCQRSNEERIASLENRIFDSSRTQTRNLEVASSVAKEQAILSARVMGVAGDLLNEIGNSTPTVLGGRPSPLSNGLLRDLGDIGDASGVANDVPPVGFSYRGLGNDVLRVPPLSSLTQLPATAHASSSSPYNLEPLALDDSGGKLRKACRSLLSARHPLPNDFEVWRNPFEENPLL